jgi:hypothetical protein
MLWNTENKDASLKHEEKNIGDITKGNFCYSNFHCDY